MTEGIAYRQESDEFFPETGNIPMAAEGLHQATYMTGHTAPGMPIELFYPNYPQFAVWFLELIQNSRLSSQ